MRIYFLNVYIGTNVGKVFISRIVYREEGYIMSSGKSSKKKRKIQKLKGGSKTRKGARKGTRKGTRKGARKGTRKGTRKQTGGSNSWKDSRLRRDLKATLSFI